jgi:hypothetical protein
MINRKNPWLKEAEKHADSFNPPCPIFKIVPATLRFLPSQNGGLPFFRYRMHYIVCNADVKRYIFHDPDKKCEICDYALSLYETNKDKYSEYKSKLRYDTYVIDRTDNKIKFLITHGALFPPLIAVAKKYGDVTDSKLGFDVTLKVTKNGKYEDYNFMPDKTSSPLSKDEIAELVKLPLISSVRQFSSIEYIHETLQYIRN